MMAELDARVKTQLVYFFELLKAQSKGQKEGPLLVNGYANIAYIIGSDGNFWAVDARWGSGDRYWYLYVFSVEDPDAWGADSQVISS